MADGFKGRVSNTPERYEDGKWVCPACCELVSLTHAAAGANAWGARRGGFCPNGAARTCPPQIGTKLVQR